MFNACYYDGVHYRKEFVKCGKPGCSRCLNRPAHGPYWYSYDRSGAYLKKRYVGLQLPVQVEIEAVPVSWRNAVFGRNRCKRKNRFRKVPESVEENS